MESIFRNRNKTLERSFGNAALFQAVAETDAPSGLSATSLFDRTADAMRKTQEYYLAQQNKEGYWWYELESNVTMTSEYLMLLHFLGLRDDARDRKMANHILRHQRNDGTWSIHFGGEGDLSTTIEAYFALKLAGFSPADNRMTKARQFVLEKGGVENCRVFTRIFLAIFGEFDWRGIPSLPVEINLIPAWFPASIYSLSSWARSTIVPLSIVLDKKPVRVLPDGAGVRELYREPGKLPPVTNKRLTTFSRKRLFLILDKLLKKVEESPVRTLREKALRITQDWILSHQEPEGDWGGIQPAMLNSILALASLGHDVSYRPIRKGLEALERFTLKDEEEIVLQSCISPVWDTALTSLALIGSGVRKEHPALVSAAKWLLSKQIFRKGDWSVRRPHLEPGGWAFEFENSWYPDVDDTAVVLMLLDMFSEEEFLDREKLDRGIGWVLGMQGKDGGWGAFDADNNLELLNQLPFGDLEAMIDPSTPDLTGRVLELLGRIGYGRSDRAVRRAVKFLKKTQANDGAWWGRWGVNYIYGTSTVLNGLAAIGEDMKAPYVKKAVDWFKAHQNRDGGWGECCESYSDESLRCRGASTPSQTAWAILGLVAADEENCDEVLHGINYLTKRQKEDGTWEEEWFTGTGFPRYFMLKYHNYRNCFPLMALGRFFSKVNGQELFP